MKQLATLLLLIAAATAYAQPVLTQWGRVSTGQSAAYRATSDTSIQAGPAGASAQWDFSNLPSGDNFRIDIVPPAATPYGASFPTAQLARVYSNGIHQFIAHTDTSTDMVGFVYSAQDLNIRYPDPWQIARRPLHFGDVYIDTLTRSYSTNGLEFSGVGISTLTADGYGTLILPDGTHTNVVRVRIDQRNSDTSVAGVLSVHFSSYQWYEEHAVFPLLNIEEERISSPFFQSHTRTTMYSGTATGVSEQDAGENWAIAVQGQHLLIEGTFADRTTYFLSICDLRGNTLLSESWQGQPGSFTLPACARQLLLCTIRSSASTTRFFRIHADRMEEATDTEYTD